MPISDFQVVGTTMEELTAGSGFYAIASTPARASTTVGQTLVNQALESARQAAGIHRGPDIPVQSVLVVDRELEARVALSQSSPVLHGDLSASWLNGRSIVETQADGTMIMDSWLAYARINDLGGDTGKGHRSHIAPSHYSASAEAKANLPIGTLRWVDGKLLGAGGVGPRGIDLPSDQALASTFVGMRA